MNHPNRTLELIRHERDPRLRDEQLAYLTEVTDAIEFVAVDSIVPIHQPEPEEIVA